jgi:hypothetical protein
MISTTILNNLADMTVGATPPPLSVKPGPPLTAWFNQAQNYRKWWRWYSGEELHRVDGNARTSTGEPAYVFPLRINPFKWIASKHVSALFGDVPDQADCLVKVSFLNKDGIKDDACEHAARVINTIWEESNGREIQLEAATVSQFLGGCYFFPRYEPTNPRLSYGLRFQMVLPDFVVPIFSPADYWSLEEVWMMYFITVDEAKSRYGVDVQGVGGKVIYAEHWTKDIYEIQIGGQVPTMRVGDVEMVMSQPNPFGFVPVVYIPHPPRVGTYYGTGHVDDVSGLIEELNRRVSDIGDFIDEVSHRLLVMRNVNAKVSEQKITNRYSSINIGSGSAIAAGKGEPEVYQLTMDATGTAQHDFIRLLLDMIDRSANLSGVAHGMDEGSQRSGVTLATRMWPLAAHAKDERTMWTTGLRELHKMALRMLVHIQKVSAFNAKVTQEHVDLKPQIGWNSMLPLDRDALVNEMVQRFSMNLVSREQAIREMHDGSDISEEIARIASDMEMDKQNEIDLAKASHPPTPPSSAQK